MTLGNALGFWVNYAGANPPPTLAAPHGVTATAGNAQVAISWTLVTGATSYNVYRSTASGTQGTKIGSSATAGYTDSTAVNGTTYFYSITAVNGAGEGAVSSQSGPATPISSAISVQKVPGTGQITVYAAGDNGTYSNINPMSYTDNHDGTITDNLTGLMWQQGDSSPTTYSQTDAATYCSGSSLGGHSDWRLPSIRELQGIVNYGNYGPAISTTYFPSTQSSFYWSSTAYDNNAAVAWVVEFTFGAVRYVTTVPTTMKYARCVRLGKSQPPSLVDNGNGTITDNVTTLMWQKQDDGTQKTWANALSYCSGLSLGGYADWRLPNVKELTSIVNYTLWNPAIDLTYFPAAQSNSYWSSTTDVHNTVNAVAWNVLFFDGGADNSAGEANVFYARCVRLGQ